jgi:hypothetical protein
MPKPRVDKESAAEWLRLRDFGYEEYQERKIAFLETLNVSAKELEFPEWEESRGRKSSLGKFELHRQKRADVKLRLLVLDDVSKPKKRGRHARAATRARAGLMDQLIYEATIEARTVLRDWKAAFAKGKTKNRVPKGIDEYDLVAKWNPWELERPGVKKAYDRHRRRISSSSVET